MAKKILILRAVLVNGAHVDADTVLAVGTDIEAEDAALLLRHGIASNLAEQLPEGVETVDLASLKVDDLKALAAAEGIDLGDATKKAEIVEAIEKARAAEQA